MNVNDALVAMVRATPIEKRGFAAIIGMVLIRLPAFVAAGAVVISIWR